MIIDVHAHASSPSARKLAESMPSFASQQQEHAARYSDPLTASYMREIEPLWERALGDPEQRITVMDRHSVSTQLVSVTPGQYYYWAAAAEAETLVELVNDDLAVLIGQASPGRLLGLGTIALQHPDLASRQLAALMRRPGFVGAQLGTTAGGRDLSDPAFDPLWQVATDTDAVLFLHPMGCTQLTKRLAPAYLNNVVGQPLETTIAVSHLIFTGVLDRFPALRLCAAHGGGYLPSYLGRSEHGYAIRPDCQSMAHPPGWYLQRMWFDSVVHSPAVARQILEVCGPHTLVTGSDYPFDMGVEHVERFLAELGVGGTSIEEVGRSNAVVLLGPHAGRLCPPIAGSDL